jgi:hypothetical protein
MRRPPGSPAVARALARAGVVLAALSQLGATCVYSPPPVLSQGQGAETLGTGRGAVAAEAGWGRSASWWNARNAADFEVESGAYGAGRLRLGVGDDLDVGLVGGVGPERTFVLGPEVKWRLAHLTLDDAEGRPGFHVALTSGLAAGSALYRYATTGCTTAGTCLRMPGAGEALPRNTFLAPYTGLVASGGIELVQMFVGLRLAASETLGNGVRDLTLYPALAFGVQLHPTRAFGLYAEGDVAGAITTYDSGDSGLMGFATVGVSVTTDRLWAHKEQLAATDAGKPAPQNAP